MNNQRISQLLVETGAYRDLDNPVILTSGELGIYYINTEKLAQDKGEFEKYGDDSSAMIEHAVKMTKEHPTFGEVIDILTEDAERLMSDDKQKYAISGGQRRDWLFSGPVAYKLNLPHISLYKEGEIEIITHDGITRNVSYLRSRDFEAIHLVDLLTEASSCYRIEGRESFGWVPMLRKNSFTIKNLVAVVTRLQGGEKRLEEQEVTVESKVAIDKSFLENHSKQPQVSIPYNKNPREWSKNYLEINGALKLVDAFNPDGGKLDRAKKFLERYKTFLENANKFDELNFAVKEKYNKNLNEIIGASEK